MNRIFQHTFTLLNADKVLLNSKWNYRNVISPYYRIYYIDEGEGDLSDASGTTVLEPGYLYIIPSFTLCDLHCESSLSQYFVQFFEHSSDGISIFMQNRRILKIKAEVIDVLLFKRLLQINPGRGINRSDNPTVYEKAAYYKEYRELNNLQNVAVFMETQGILWQLFSKFLVPELRKQPTTSIIPVKLAETLDYIQLHLSSELSVASLAARVSQHPDYFSRKFKDATGLRPLAYIHEKRIERAQYLIATSRLSYSEISIKVGFSDLAYFSRAFKQITGLSPSRYKKEMYSVGFHEETY